MPESTLSALRVGGDELRFRVTGGQSDGALVAFEVTIPPGGGPPALHRHPPFELYRVHEGELAFYLEEDTGRVERLVGAPGDVVAIPGGREHTVRNESSEEARAFVVLAPAGRMEEFVRAAGELSAQGPPRPQDVIRLAEAHGIEMTRSIEELDAAG